MNQFPVQPPVFDGHGRTVEAGSCFDWLRQGWGFFTADPGIWIGITVISFAIYWGVQIVPLIGTLAAHLMAPVLVAGMLHACRKASEEQAVEVADLFVGFRVQTNGLIMLGVGYMVAMLVIGLFAVLLGGGGLAGGLMMGSPIGFGVAFGGMMLAFLVSAVLSIPVLMAIAFAPALVFFNGMTPVAAAKSSFNTCVQNFLPLFVFSLMLLVLMFFAALPVLLGFLVLIPVMVGAVYAAYRDIYMAL